MRKKATQLRTQMTALSFAGVFLICFLIALMAGGSTKRALVDRAERDAAAMLTQVIRNLEYYLDDMEKLAALSNVQSSVLRMLVNDTDFRRNQSQYYENSQQVRAILTDLSRLRPEITSITIVGQNGSLADTASNQFSTGQATEDWLSWYSAALNSGGNSVFLPPHQITDVYGRAQSVISLTHPIIISRGAKPLGAILINLSTDTLAEICGGAGTLEGGYIFIADAAGNYVYHPDPAYQGAQRIPTPLPDDEIKRLALSGEASFAYGDRLVLSAAIEAPGYRVIYAMPRALITGAADRAQTQQILFGALASAVIALVLSLLLSRRVFRPLDRLRKLMGRVQKGDFDVRADDTPKNEIGELAGGFNAMIDHNLRLMRRIMETEKAKRKAELDALQSQITPHFLYNTLDSIVWMSNYRPQVAAAMADALAKLFRLMLGGGEDVVPLKQEFEHVTQYLKIQKMRYDSKFEYEISLDEACQMIRVPKLILQPLVENAIYHGIKPTRKKCLLKVLGFLDGDELALMVMDDGAGIGEADLSRILTAERVSDKMLGGVGVKNINERIQLYCPGNYGLGFVSAENLGTVAILRLPASGVSAPSPAAQ